jgi:hypothetical protein
MNLIKVFLIWLNKVIVVERWFGFEKQKRKNVKFENWLLLIGLKVLKWKVIIKCYKFGDIFPIYNFQNLE